jgi:hypothetical protein
MFNLFSKKGNGLFFGVGTGRCGTMFLANVLNAHPRILCLHEGMRRNGTTKCEALLDYLTLHNFAAYSRPSEARTMFAKARSIMPVLRKQKRVSLLGDIAYNYAPFIASIHSKFPAAKIIYIYRNGIEFVRSVITDVIPDPCPVGWQEKRKQSREERYIELGRLRPLPSNPEYLDWPHMSVIAKNSWLWAETNRIILDGIRSVPAENVLQIRFEDFIDDVETGYSRIITFLGIKDFAMKSVREILHTRINKRENKVLPVWSEWSHDMRQDFLRFGGGMMRELGYITSNSQELSEW